MEGCHLSVGSLGLQDLLLRSERFCHGDQGLYLLVVGLRMQSMLPYKEIEL